MRTARIPPPLRLTLPSLLLVAACEGSDSAPAADAAPDADTRTLERHQLESVTIPPGGDQVFCSYVPPTGVERHVSRIAIDMNPGSHHLTIERIVDPEAEPAWGPSPCTSFDPLPGYDGRLGGAQQPQSETVLPDGVGIELRADHGLRFSHHVYNPGDQPLETYVDVTLELLEPEDVVATAGRFVLGELLNVPVGPSVRSYGCRLPAAMNLISLAGHMHAAGVRFEARRGEDLILESDTWQEPAPALFPGDGMPIALGETLSWACTYENGTGGPLDYGDSVTENEMCVLNGLYYPAVDELEPFGSDRCLR